MNGKRTIIINAELDKTSWMPALADPWFLTFNADIEFHVVVSAEDLRNVGSDQLARKWE